MFDMAREISYLEWTDVDADGFDTQGSTRSGWCTGSSGWCAGSSDGSTAGVNLGIRKTMFFPECSHLRGLLVFAMIYNHAIVVVIDHEVDELWKRWDESDVPVVDSEV